MIFVKILVPVILVLAVVCIISIWHASTHFHKVYYRLSSDKISKPVKFVLLTDLHDKEYGEENSRLLKAIEEERPDAVLVAGDMVTARPEKEGHYKDISLRLMQKLTRQYPVYYGLGNHEAKMGWNKKLFGNQYECFMEELTAAGVRILQNEYETMSGLPIRIYGLDMAQIYYKRSKQTPMNSTYLQEQLGSAEETYYNILLAHNPAYFEQYAQWKPDLVLSGHVHGGLVRLPFLGGVISPSLQIFPKYDGGRFIKGKVTMILSRGLGFHSVEFRMWNPGELVVIEVLPVKRAIDEQK